MLACLGKLHRGPLPGSFQPFFIMVESLDAAKVHTLLQHIAQMGRPGLLGAGCKPQYATA